MESILFDCWYTEYGELRLPLILELFLIPFLIEIYTLCRKAKPICSEAGGIR